MSENKETKIEQVIAEMEKVAKSEKLMEIPWEIIDEAKQFFKSIHQEGFDVGHPAIITAFACLYFVIKTDPSCPAISFRQFKEAIPDKYREDGFTIIPRYDPKKIFRTYQKIVEKYGIAPQTCTVRPTIFVKKFGLMMGFDKATLEKAVALAEKMVKKRVHQGRSPIVSAAACLRVIDLQYGKKRKRREIAKLCGITDAAIGKTLDIPFFKKRFPREKPKVVRKEILKKLLREFLSGLQNYQDPLYLNSLKQKFRHSFSEELQGLYIDWKHWISVLEELSSEGLIALRFTQGCESLARGRTPIDKIDCFHCSKMNRLRGPCPYVIAHFKKTNHHQHLKSASSAPFLLSQLLIVNWFYFWSFFGVFNLPTHLFNFFPYFIRFLPFSFFS